MGKVRFFKAKYAFWLFCVNLLLFGCADEADMTVMKISSYDNARSILSTYIVIENNRYVLKISEKEANELGISDEYYNSYLQMKNHVNQSLKDAEKEYPYSKIVLCDPNRSLQSKSSKPDSFIPNLKSSFRYLAETRTTIRSTLLTYCCNQLLPFGFQNVVIAPTTLSVTVESSGTAGFQLYIISVSFTDDLNHEFVIKPSGDDGRPIYYAYDPNLWGTPKEIASFPFNVENIHDDGRSPTFFSNRVSWLSGFVSRAFCTVPESASTAAIYIAYKEPGE